MKVFIDTNILISSALFPYSGSGIPESGERTDTFLSSMMLCVTIVRVPAKAVQEEEKIRDEKNRPIFRAAITAGADLFYW